MSRIIALIATLAVSLFTLSIFAQTHQEHQHPMMMHEQETEEAAGQEGIVSEEEPIEVGNKICPVSGEEIVEDEVYQVEYEGKIYNLCCKMCEKDFKKDPEKYIEKLEELEGKEKHEHSHHHEEHQHQH